MNAWRPRGTSRLRVNLRSAGSEEGEMAARKHGVGWIAITISALSLAIGCEDTGQMTGTALPGPTAGMAAGAGGAIAAGGTAAPAPGGATGGAGVTPVPT